MSNLFPCIASEFDLRNQVAKEFFPKFHTIIENNRVDFLVSSDKSQLYKQDFLWAESKLGNTPIETMFAQLLLTVKPLLTSGEIFPPKYLGVFNKEVFALIEYYNVQGIFALNDLNWTERPSGVSQKTVNTITPFLSQKIVFQYDTDANELKNFIAKNFVPENTRTIKLQVTKNNFIAVYNKWLKDVYPYISKANEEARTKAGIAPCDFFLADLISKDNKTIAEGLKIVLNQTRYEIQIKVDLLNTVDFNLLPHTEFWNKYQRPPKKEYYEYILNRRELLVPQDIRERKGAYFTPQIWVEKAHEYLAKTLGENWQDEYYIWDCCAGTCNLLANLTQPYRIWASTLDTPDVNIVHEAIKNGRMNLLESHVFQFDFLNDSFDKLPQSLRDVLDDEEKRKKLIILINPPYAEATTAKTITGTGKNKKGVSITNKTYEKYKDIIGKASNEIFALFLVRIFAEIPGCILAQFSTLKTVQAANFADFRQFFKAKFLNGFIVPANTFDNVNGQFPIGFTVWNLGETPDWERLTYNVFDGAGSWIGTKDFFGTLGKSLNKWVVNYLSNDKEIGLISSYPPDFQNNNKVAILSKPLARYCYKITQDNFLIFAVYFAVRFAFTQTWLNDRDQFLYPTSNKTLASTADSPLFAQEKEVFLYEQDKDFQNDCIIYTLFHGQNRIAPKGQPNHWLPFTAADVHAQDNFRSSFMSDYLKTRAPFTPAAQAVLDAGRELWTYYHETIKTETAKPFYLDASLYEIREYFKGRDEKGRLNTKATDAHFNKLDANLRTALKALAIQIQPKVYEYGFLKN